ARRDAQADAAQRHLGTAHALVERGGARVIALVGERDARVVAAGGVAALAALLEQRERGAGVLGHAEPLVAHLAERGARGRLPAVARLLERGGRLLAGLARLAGLELGAQVPAQPEAALGVALVAPLGARGDVGAVGL